MHHQFCYEMRMSRLVTRIVTLAFVALLAACGTVRTSGIRNTSKTFSTVVVDAGHGDNAPTGSLYGPAPRLKFLSAFFGTDSGEEN